MNKFLIDVRTSEEFNSGHRDGAINIPVEEISDGKLGVITNIPKDTPIELYCLSGSRAGYAKLILGSLGYVDVVNGGGFSG
jgi:phage shock protein E